MNAIVTTGIVLARTDYQEADRILTIITPDNGKIRVIAKGVRKVKSKLAGGIELFSISHVSFIPGKKEIGTLISTRLDKHFGGIVSNIDRTMLAYEVLKIINRITEDSPEADYFHLLASLLEALNDSSIHSDVIRFWMYMQLLKLGGHTPNLTTDMTGTALVAGSNYNFSYEDMTFAAHASGSFTPAHIKLLRLALGTKSPKDLQKVQGTEELLGACQYLAQTMLSQYVKLQ